MRAVPVEINRVGVRRQIAVGPDLAHKIKAANDLRRGKQSVDRRVLRVARVGPVSRLISIHGSGSAKLLMGVIDPGIEHSDSHAVSFESGVLHSLRADVGDCFAQVQLVNAHGPDGHYVRQTGNRGNAGSVHAHDHRVEGLGQSRDFMAAHCANGLHEFVMFAGELADVLPLLDSRQPSAGPLGPLALGHRQRHVAEAHNNLDLTDGLLQPRIDDRCSAGWQG